LKKNAYYELLFHASLEAIVKVDHRFRIIEVNSQFIKLFKCSTEALLGKSKDLSTVIEQDKNAMSIVKELLFKGEMYKDEGVRIDSAGNSLDVIITGIPIVENDIFKGAFILYKDVTSEKQAQTELSRQMMIFESLFKNSSDAIVRIDSQERIIEVNSNFEDFFGYTFDEIVGKTTDDLISHPDEFEHNLGLTHTLLKGEKVVIEGKRYAKDGSSKDFLVQGVPIILGDEVIGGYGIFTNISERKRAEEEILYISYHDQLTGVYNRRFFEEEMHRMDTSRNMPLSLIMADVNGLKLTNDAFGHGKGDALLKRLAEILVHNCRAGEIISRLGGDEFVILMPGTTAQDAEQVVKRIQKSCNDELFNSISLSMSFGWDEKKHADEPLSSLFKRVEDYMYSHKLVESPSVRGKMFETIIKTLHEKNKREERHSSRVSLYCEAIGNAMKLNTREVEGLKMAGWLHDIGKIAVDERILNKKGRLSQEEWFEVRKHPEVCYSILSSVNELSELANCVLAHHERYDGKGYPKGLMGEQIPIGARIIAVADSYDAMTTARTYCPMLTKKDATAELLKHAGTQFDPEVVQVFVNQVLK
jgi:diguanylate cyclase (GGDEF)-like protein/PAS domain S-box-containing protein